MLTLMPRNVPPLHHLLEDLGRPTAAALAAALDVHPRTVWRWMAADEAPRPVMLALFWVTRWGQSAVDCEAYNQMTLRLAIARCLAEENEALAGRVNRMAGIADFGSANDPAPGITGVDKARLALKAFLQEPAQTPNTAPGEAGPTEQSSSGSIAEETQQPRALQRG